MPALIVKPSSIALQVPVAEAAELWGYQEDIGFQVFSGLFLRTAVFGLEKWVDIRYRPRNLEFLRDFCTDTCLRISLSQNKAKMTSLEDGQSLALLLFKNSRGEILDTQTLT